MLPVPYSCNIWWRFNLTNFKNSSNVQIKTLPKKDTKIKWRQVGNLVTGCLVIERLNHNVRGLTKHKPQGEAEGLILVKLQN